MQLWTRRFLLRTLPTVGESRLVERYFVERNASHCSFIESTDDASFLSCTLRIAEPESHISSQSSSLPLSLELSQKDTDEQAYVTKRNSCKYGVIFESFAMDGGLEMRKYHNEHGGFMCLECSFHTKEAALQFTPPSFCGREITHTSLGNDLHLVGLTEAELTHLLDSL